MKFVCPLFAVTNMEASKRFYQEVLQQTIAMDVGKNVTFSGGFALQEGFGELAGFDPQSIVYGAKNAELYFEVEDLDAVLEHLKRYPIVYLHGPKEYSWGQRVLRLFDPDQNIIEIGESMEVVNKRFLRAGMTVEETCKRTMFPQPFILKCRSEIPAEEGES